MLLPYCVFRSKSSTDSDGNRSLIPVEIDRFDPTLAEAILDRVAHKITMKGESMRKKKRKLTK